MQKFDVNDDRKGNLFTHQYMTNVLAPSSEAKSIYNGYQKSGLLNTAMTFIIPVYNNMPDIQTQSPNINTKDFTKVNEKVYCNIDNVNVRTGPSTSYEIITTISKNTKMTRIEKGKQSGERWDKVILDNGIVGFIYQTYVTKLPEVQIQKIDVDIDKPTIKKGETKKLKVTITPQEASNHKVLYTSSNMGVATVDEKGTIKAIRSGKATITVKAQENNIQGQISITVYSPVTKITLDQSDIYMQVGDKFEINAIIEPNDADEKGVIYKSNNVEIATVQEDGIINSLKEGTTKIVVSSKENLNINAECEVNVVRKMEDSEIHFDSSLKVDSLEVSGIEYSKNKVSDIKEKIITDLEIEIVDYQNRVLKDTDIVGTGSKIRVKENGNIIRQYQIVIYGDVNGDGKINSVDLLVLQRHILEIKPLTAIFRKAANINKNGKKPSSVDLLLIQRHILQLQLIEQ